VAVAVYVVSFMLLRALSRYREYAADRGAAVLTGRPSALASALLALNDRMASIPTRDLRTAAQMNAFFIIPARQKSWLMHVFATHPSIEKRIAALARYEEQLQRGA
jgi:heat shock protein HtpX